MSVNRRLCWGRKLLWGKLWRWGSHRVTTRSAHRVTTRSTHRTTHRTTHGATPTADVLHALILQGFQGHVRRYFVGFVVVGRSIYGDLVIDRHVIVQRSVRTLAFGRQFFVGQGVIGVTLRQNIGIAGRIGERICRRLGGLLVDSRWQYGTVTLAVTLAVSLAVTLAVTLAIDGRQVIQDGVPRDQRIILFHTQ